MSSSLGERLKVTLFGQSHGTAIGCVVEGLPPGEAIDTEALDAFLARRAPGRSALSTSRREGDVPEFVSGLVDGVTCGAPLCAVIRNSDTRSADYEQLRRLMRPSHADYPAHLRYGGHQDVRGGGHFSGRLTAPLCVAGGIVKQILARRGIHVGAQLQAAGSVEGARFDPVNLTAEDLARPLANALPTLDPETARAMADEIEAARSVQDSVGGLIECAAIGLPAGLGDPLFGGLDSRLAAALYGIPAVRGVEFGAGFAAAALRGSRHNDPYCLEGDRVCTATNHHGGILGGITTGMPLILRVAIKPTPSIARPQQTVDIARMAPATLSVTGRHDPCIAPRAVPCIEAAVALILLDVILIMKGSL